MSGAAFRLSHALCTALALSFTALTFGDSPVAHAADAAPVNQRVQIPRDPPALHGVTRRFRFEQKRYMRQRHGAGAAVYAPRQANEDAAHSALPIVVFLHGLNADERVSPHMDGASDDLRTLADTLMAEGHTAPFILAAPTHARFATGTKVMWHDFDLDAFLRASESALGSATGAPRIDRSRVILVGYSGGGCSITGGLLGPAAEHAVALVAIDTCFDAESNARLLHLAETRASLTYFQRTWSRNFGELETGAEHLPNLFVHEFSALGSNPHAAILHAALRDALPKLLPAVKDAAASRVATR